MKDKLGNTLRQGCIVVLPDWSHNRLAKVLGSRGDMVRVQQDHTGRDDQIFFNPEDLVRVEALFK